MWVETITTNAKSTSITFVHSPIVEVPSPGHVHALPAVQRGEVVYHKRQAKRKAIQEESTKNFSIGYIMTKHIDVAFDDEEESNVLPIEQQLTFWRNSAKFLKRLLVATKQHKSTYYKEFMMEINMLNRIIENFGSHDEVIDPVVLKANIKQKITNETRKKRRVVQEEQKSETSSVYKEDPTMQEHVHKIVEEDVKHPVDDNVIEKEHVISEGKNVDSKVDLNVDSNVEDRIDLKVEHVDKEVKHIEHENFIVDNKGFDEDPADGVDKEEDIVDKEEENPDKLEEHVDREGENVDSMVDTSLFMFLPLVSKAKVVVVYT
ncbi:uncharacterized protein LOC109823838 isoform X2 [Asparagus officinalis]|uniref:uncharacterized protein LOC109823838 isoform X1 n=1 Tax=Asparagus officinalis TaxID=4686 RepID=UPI00098E2EE3|nr:uncharacterized protein LOC109823838 isoform X1 [Asparagus officinalis]XP_020245835.1 uncharacterized protein LOC109823838 isoform X2 [Asparagus officinalis]